jgi:SRSO17 transposase
MSGHFVFLRVRPASQVHRRAVNFADLPIRWPIAEWPPGQAEPTRYWLSNLPATTPRRTLIRLAKLRWRIEHDYRGLITLVSAAHAFCTLQRLDPKTPAPA